MFMADDKTFPRLKGKAAEIKAIVPAVLELCSSKMDLMNAQHKLIIMGLTMMTTIETILDESALVYKSSDASAKKFEQSCWKFVQINSALASYFHPRNQVLFHHTLKHHYMLHLGIAARHINPRLGWCYQGEAFMKVVKQIVSSSQHGAGPSRVAPKCMRKYSQGLGMNFLPCPWKR